MKRVAQVISGGQTGVDIAALRAAKSLGISTGGWIPQGAITQSGVRFDWVKEFGLTIHESPYYAQRTFSNVKDSDLTIRIAQKFSSPGELCTLKAIEHYKRPYFDVFFTPVGNGHCVASCNPVDVAEVIRNTSKLFDRLLIVNFAGNSERTAPGIELAAETFIRQVLQAAEA